MAKVSKRGGLLMSADLVFSNMIAKVFEGIRIPANLAGICFMLCFGFISSYCGVRYTAYRKDPSLSREAW